MIKGLIQIAVIQVLDNNDQINPLHHHHHHLTTNVCVRVIKSISLLELRSFLDTGSFLLWINNYILKRKNANAINACQILGLGSEQFLLALSIQT